MKHIIISRLNFIDKELMNKYLLITKDILIPSLKSQIDKNFEWALIIKPEDVEFVKNQIDYNFIPFSSNIEFRKYTIENKYDIQTRHDVDDWMSSKYVSTIHELYNENIKKYNKFLIQAQPKKLDYHTKKEVSIGKYHDKRNSMFLSLCQDVVDCNIFDRKHGQMYEIAENVITIPEGYTKWVIHGDNISCKKI